VRARRCRRCGFETSLLNKHRVCPGCQGPPRLPGCKEPGRKGCCCPRCVQRRAYNRNLCRSRSTDRAWRDRKIETGRRFYARNAFHLGMYKLLVYYLKRDEGRAPENGT
jgi:hypothetical protein